MARRADNLQRRLQPEGKLRAEAAQCPVEVKRLAGHAVSFSGRGVAGPEPDIAPPSLDRLAVRQPPRVIAGAARRLMKDKPVAKMDQRMVDDIAKHRRQRYITGCDPGFGGKPLKPGMRKMCGIYVLILLPPLPVARPVDQFKTVGFGKPVAHQRVAIRHAVPVAARHQRVFDAAAEPEQPSMRLALRQRDPLGDIIRLHLRRSPAEGQGGPSGCEWTTASTSPRPATDAASMTKSCCGVGDRLGRR